MNAEALPQSIRMYDTERYSRDLDLDYVDRSGRELAANLRTGILSTDIAYQPGDGTFYGIVITPLVGLISAPPRIKDGVTWERHAVRGLRYEEGNVLVSLLDHRAYPLALAGNRDAISADYVASHWDISEMSAASIALLFRAIAWYLDNPPVKE